VARLARFAPCDFVRRSLAHSEEGASRAITYAEALEGALAWGWIDSQKRALDATAWLQRFTPRAAKSPWSKINRAKAEAMIAAGTMEAPGLAEVERAKRDGRWERAYDGARSSAVPADLAAALDRKPRARAFFDALDGANRFAILYRVRAATKPETRAERIARFVGMCARGASACEMESAVRRRDGVLSRPQAIAAPDKGAIKVRPQWDVAAFSATLRRIR
jgi:uncharacterized protein YdeI (YjbR/CyaY-like superfamily)